MWLIVILILLAAALAWFVRRPDEEPAAPPPRPKADPDIDYDELERAEREVQEAAGPDDIRDWGPGAPKD